MNILREGPRHLVIETNNQEKTVQGIQKIIGVAHHIKAHDDMYESYLKMLSLLDDTWTILLLTLRISPHLAFEKKDFISVLAVPIDCENVLIKMMTSYPELNITNVRSTPRMIIMRTTGDETKYMNQVCRDISGDKVEMEQIFEAYGEGTMIIFTDKSLRCSLGVDDFFDDAIYTMRTANDVIKFLNNRLVKYVNVSIDHKDWSALNIKIYDAYEDYEKHYRRLTMVLNALDCGLILGESWGKDAALAFHSVGVYQVKLYTYLEPKAIKEIIFGLEYDVNGKRLVDYDLFKKRKKISWSDVRRKGDRDRESLGYYYRRCLNEKLPETVLRELIALES